MTESSPDRAPRTYTVCVYCGSRSGSDAAYASAAGEVGRLIGEQGWGLVYGGGNVGLMGIVADAALAAGARVTGVIPRSLVAREVGHSGLQSLHVVDTMHERKQLMAEHADAFLAMPGGIGTLEELYEVWTWRQLGYHAKPIGLLNVAGYYDTLLSFMATSVEQGFLGPQQMTMVQTGSEPAELLTRLHQLAHAPSGLAVAADYGRI
jgi:uncharacterized protein (TIGR00730 family)